MEREESSEVDSEKRSNNEGPKISKNNLPFAFGLGAGF
jgi:hypothetical protein